MKADALDRPDHLEPVTHQENVRRGETGSNYRDRTHCVNGHPFNPETTVMSQGHRRCKLCRRKSGGH